MGGKMDCRFDSRNLQGIICEKWHTSIYIQYPNKNFQSYPDLRQV